MFKNKFQARRFWSSIIIIVLCLSPAFYFQSFISTSIGMMIYILIEFTLFLSALADTEDKYWLTRYFDPHNKNN